MKAENTYLRKEFRIYFLNKENEGIDWNFTKTIESIYQRGKEFLEKLEDSAEKETYEQSWRKLFPNGAKNIPISTKRNILGNEKTISKIPFKIAELLSKIYQRSLTDVISENKELLNEANDYEQIFVDHQKTFEGLKNPVFTNYGKLENEIFKILKDSKSNVYLFLTDEEMKFFLNYMITLVGLLRNRKSKIFLTYFDTSKNTERTYKLIRMLKYVGVRVRVVKDLKQFKGIVPFVGIITDPEEKDECKLLSIDLFNEFYSILDSKFYFLIKPFFESIRIPHLKFEHFQAFVPNLISLSEDSYRLLLQNVSQYKNCQIEFIKFPVSKLGSFLSHQFQGIKQFKLHQHKLFTELFEKLDLDKVYAIRFKNSKTHVINIPVLEEVNSKFYIAEGHTRLYNAFYNWKHNSIIDENIYCAVVHMISHDCETNIHTQLQKLSVKHEYFRKSHGNEDARNIEKKTHDIYNWVVDFPLELDK